jgi:phosphatidylglycerophosphate synthase
MKRSQIPNAITIARMVMALPLLWLLAQERFREALALALLAGTSDVVDGFLAKRYGWQSVLGGILDPIADKLMLSVCFLVCGGVSIFQPGWLRPSCCVTWRSGWALSPGGVGRAPFVRHPRVSAKSPPLRSWCWWPWC